MGSRAAAAVSVVAVAAIAAAAAWLASASLQQDFAAYWVAGAARRAGLDPYVNHVGSAVAPTLWDGVAVFRHSRFLYPPLVAELFRPLAALPYRIAKASFTAGGVAALLAAALALSGRRRDGAVDRALLLAGAALFFPVYLCLERGQIDLYVLALLALAWRLRSRAWLAGAALAGAVLLKPAVVGVLPIVVAVGRGRWALATVGAALALAALNVAAAGPTLSREYARVVLPRALLYGEGGTAAMLLPDERLPHDSDGGEGAVALDGRRYRTAIWDVPVSASVPRLLAPEAPSRATAVGPYAVAAAALLAAARALSRRRAAAEHDDRAGVLFFGTALACVVASPSGWAMGLVWGLPIAALARRLRNAGAVSGHALVAVGAAWLACAVPAPFAGWPAVAGAALAATATGLALSGVR
jgi:hypothetical protein